jgi:hypothetical protein
MRHARERDATAVLDRGGEPIAKVLISATVKILRASLPTSAAAVA